ncbi:MAG: response regulator transcription factor [Chitinophagaceae bacterium]|nr:response regulator transcription factor [Chitinophagaceae bacterium]
MSHQNIRIVIVDDHSLIRETWRMLLQNVAGFEIAGCCGTGTEALSLVQQERPDIILLDINMFPLTGYDIAEKAAELFPEISIIGLSVNSKPKHAVKLVELGAKGYITKNSTLEEICHGIREVYQGRYYICEDIINSIADGEPLKGKTI